jgi:hypothetical protein
MYVMDLTHFLDAKGAIAPERGPARKMADFLTAVVAHASDFDRPRRRAGPGLLQVPQARPARGRNRRRHVYLRWNQTG